MSTVIGTGLALLIVLVLACLTIGAAKGFTLAKTLRIIRWAWCHPGEALTGTWDKEHDE